MSILIDDLKYRLVRGLPILYDGVNIRQPKIQDLDILGITYYSNITYIFCIQKEHLKLWDTLQNEFSGKTLFQSLFIQERFYEANNKLDTNTSILMLLRESLKFFLDIEDIRKIVIDVENERLVVLGNREFEDKIFEVPIFELNNDNFEEFSELIRTITCNDVIKIEKEEIDNLEHYDDENLQRLIEEQYKIYKETEKKEEEENKVTINEVIGAVCMSENSKYDFTTITNITMWQLQYFFNFLLEKENVEIVKSQFTSGNYNFEKVPDLNWIKKTKVKLQKCKKLIDK